MRRSILFCFALLFLATGVVSLWIGWNRFGHTPSAGASEPELSLAIDQFRLTERSGRQFHSRELKDRVWVASFFFASCPQSCTRQNQVMQQLAEEFGPEGMRFLSISCDPVNDTPETLREYARNFKADEDDWLFLTGELAYIRELGQKTFLMPVNERAHVDRFVLVDKWGNIRGYYNWHEAKELENLKKKMVQLDRETEPPADEDAA